MAQTPTYTVYVIRRSRLKALCFYEHGDANVLRYEDVFMRRGWPGLDLETRGGCSTTGFAHGLAHVHQSG